MTAKGAKNPAVAAANKLRLKHGGAKMEGYDPIYNLWRAMMRRCYTPTTKHYERYGGRGIKVCEAWRNSYLQFKQDIGPKPDEWATLDRINNDGNYEPFNCRWTNKSIQSRNTRKIRVNNTSGFRGVYFEKRRKKWFAMIICNKKRFNLGYYDTPRDSAIAYDTFVIVYNTGHTKNFTSFNLSAKPIASYRSASSS